jgi:uroporphyrinogen decarboxylase
MTEDLMHSDGLFTNLKLGRADKVPFLPFARDFAIKQAGVTFSEAIKDMKKFVDSQVRFAEEYHTSAVWDPGIAPYFVELVGGSIIVFEDDCPASKPALQSKEQLRKLDLSNSPNLIQSLKRITALKKAVGSSYPVIGYLVSPFSFACIARGMQEIMLDMILNPDLVRELQALYIPFAKTFTDELANAGADLVWVTNPNANRSCISRDHYKELVYPYSKEFYHNLKEQNMMSIFHTCGNWSDRLDLILDEGSTCFWVDKSDLPALKESVGQKVCIMGNVHVTEVLLQGNTEDVVRETARCLEAVGHGPGYILSGSCALSRDTPPANLLAMSKACQDFVPNVLSGKP